MHGSREEIVHVDGWKIQRVIVVHAAAGPGLLLLGCSVCRYEIVRLLLSRLLVELLRLLLLLSEVVDVR